MLIVFIVAFIILGLVILSKSADDVQNSCNKPYTKTICGRCGGSDCIVGCDKNEDENERVTSRNFIKPEKEHIVTNDEIRHTAYLMASADNFSKNPETYWHEAEKQLNGYK